MKTYESWRARGKCRNRAKLKKCVGVFDFPLLKLMHWDYCASNGGVDLIFISEIVFTDSSSLARYIFNILLRFCRTELKFEAVTLWLPLKYVFFCQKISRFHEISFYGKRHFLQNHYCIGRGNAMLCAKKKHDTRSGPCEGRYSREAVVLVKEVKILEKGACGDSGSPRQPTELSSAV